MKLERSLATLTLALAAAAALVPIAAVASGSPSGERALGNATIEPAYNDFDGSTVFLLTPNRLAPLGAANPINAVDGHAVAPLYLVVYPPGTPGTFDCMGVPGNCPDHDGVIAGLATSVRPGVYGSDPTAVPGHDHLVGLPRTGDFNVAWHVYVELFTGSSPITHITTLSQLQAAWASGTVDPTATGQGIDTGITFVCSVVSAAAYAAATPLS